MNPPTGIKRANIGKITPGFGRAFKETKLQVAPQFGAHLKAVYLNIGLQKLGTGKDAFVRVGVNSEKLYTLKKSLQPSVTFTYRFADGTAMKSSPPPSRKGSKSGKKIKLSERINDDSYRFYFYTFEREIAKRGITWGLTDPNPRVREDSVSKLIWIKNDGTISDSALEQLVPNLLRHHRMHRDNDPSVRLKVANALCIIGGPFSVALLKEMINDFSKDVRTKVLFSLAHTGGNDAVQALTDMLSDQVSYIRREAVSALGRIGDATTTEILINMLSDPAWDVRSSAVEALSRIGGKAAMIALETAAKDDSNHHVRRAAQKALAKRKQ